MTVPSSSTEHFLLMVATVWGEAAQVLGIYASEREAMVAAQWERFAAGDASPVRFSLEVWRDGDRLRVATSSPPFSPGGDPFAGWIPG